MKKLYIVIALLLPMTATAQQPPVQVPYSCGEGNAFTISIPVKFRASMTVQYQWYRNDTAVTPIATLAAGARAIAYTIPANKAYGTNVAFHFKYTMNDNCADCWDSSPLYAVTFLSCAPPQASAIMGDTMICAGNSRLSYSVTPAEGASYAWTVPAGWVITKGRNTNNITVTANAAGGVISITLGNGCGVGNTRTLEVAVTVGSVSSPGAIDFDVFSCSSGVSSPGVIGFDAYSCSGGVSTPGVISFGAYSCSGGVSTAGTISFGPY